MNWLRQHISGIKKAFGAEQLPERVFWRFALVNYFLIVVTMSLNEGLASGVVDPGAILGSLLLAALFWLLPIRLLKVRGVSRFRLVVTLAISVLFVLGFASASIDGVTGESLPPDAISPGTAAWISLSAFTVVIYRAVWQPSERRLTRLAIVISRSAATALYTTIALFSGTAIHPLLLGALDGPLDNMSPSRIYVAESYLAATRDGLAAIPFEPVVLALAFAALAVGSQFTPALHKFLAYTGATASR